MTATRLSNQLILLFVLSLVACIKNPNTQFPSLNVTTQISVLNQEPKVKEWTVLIYMAGDNNLGRYALEDLYEMEAGFKSGQYAGSTKKMDVVVELDLPGNTGIDRLHIEQQKEVYNSNLLIGDTFADTITARKLIRSPTIETLNETQDVTQSERLAQFLNWGIQNYPAQKYIVILWGHGTGWGAQFNQENGILFDDFPKTYVDIPNLGKILKQVQQTSNNDNPFDIVINDACVMQSVEVLSEFQDSARYIMGSTQIQNYHGLPYRRFFYSINKNDYVDITKEERVNRCGEDQSCWTSMLLPRLVKATWHERGLQHKLDPAGEESYTFGSFETSHFKNELQNSLEDLSQSLIHYIQAKDSPSRQLLIYQAFAEIPRYQGGSVEVGHVLAYLEYYVRQNKSLNELDEAELAIIDSIQAAQQSLLYSSVNYFFGSTYLDENDYPLGSMKVLSIWIPQSILEYEMRRSEFLDNSAYYQAHPTWGQFLDLLYNINPQTFQ